MSSIPPSFRLHRSQFGILFLLGVMGILTFITTQFYLGLFFLALVVVVITHPLYDWVLRKVKSPIWASIITSFLFLFIVIIPATIFFLIVAGQATQLLSLLSQNKESILISLAEFQTRARETGLLDLASLDIAQIAERIFTLLGNILTLFLVPLATNVIVFFMNLTFFMLILVYLYPDREKFLATVTDLLPISEASSKRFMTRFTLVTQKMTISMFLAALVQGLLSGLMFWMLGIPGAAFWTVVMIFASLLPLGSGLIWTPTSILLILTGNIWQGIILLLWGMIVVSSADNVLRGFMLKGKSTAIPEIWTLLSTLGGVMAFGFFGIIYGPIIVAGFLTALDIYREDRDTGNTSVTD